MTPADPGTRALAGALLRRAAAGPGLEASRLLVILEGPGAGNALPLSGEETLGRGAAASLRLDDPSLSRVHLRLRALGGAVLVEDLGSKNGTRVNGRRLRRRPRAVAPGDLVTAGRLRLRIGPVAAGSGPGPPLADPGGPGRLLSAGAALALLLATALAWLAAG